MSEPTTRVDIRGFSKESTDIVRDMEGFGWTFRPSNHGVVGRAPHPDKTTISISRKLRKSNHSYQRAWADFRRWLRTAHPELTDVAEQYLDRRIEADEVAETDPVVAGILERRAITRSTQQLNELTETDPVMKAAAYMGHSETQTEREAPPVMSTATVSAAQTDEPPTITNEEPWHLKKSKDDVLRVTKRTWSNGRIDFHCAYEGCPVTSRNPRSITQHYGAVHTRPIGTYVIAAPKPVEVTKQYVEAQQSIVSEPVEELRGSTSPEPDQGPEVPVTVEDAERMIAAVMEIVSQPLLERMKILAEQVNVLTKERDEAQEALTKIQSDWDALRSLLGNR